MAKKKNKYRYQHITYILSKLSADLGRCNDIRKILNKNHNCKDKQKAKKLLFRLNIWMTIARILGTFIWIG